ncbi:MAG: DNA-processing protein DprA [Elainellaceae cyanobacterium]
MFQLIQERAFWLGWACLQGIGPILIRRLHQHFGVLSAAWAADVLDLVEVEGIGFQTADAIARERSKLDPEQLLVQQLQSNPHFLTPADCDYPQLLLEIPDPPPVLYYRGQIDSAEMRGDKQAIALVGTRNPTEYGKRWTRIISRALAQTGFTVVSGLAEGIDTVAHQCCLEVGGRTIAILGTGVDVVYPASNRKLAQAVGNQGLLLSEYPAKTQPERANFPRRNRIIAGLCRATLVLEAPTKSGALITAQLANDYGRDVYTLPGSLDQRNSLGCLHLIEKGAQLILGENQLLDALGTLPQFQNRFDVRSTPDQLSLLNQPTIQLEPDLDCVFKAVGLEPSAFDLIVHDSGLSTSSVSSALVQLEMMGLVNHLPGMLYQRC